MPMWINLSNKYSNKAGGPARALDRIHPSCDYSDAIRFLADQLVNARPVWAAPNGDATS